VDRRILEARGVPSLRDMNRRSRRANVGGKDTPVKSIHQGDSEEHLLDLDEIARQEARRMLAQALEAEVDVDIDLSQRSARRERPRFGRSQWLRQGERGPLGSRGRGGEGSEGQ
jgi:hypothetical protein